MSTLRIASRYAEAVLDAVPDGTAAETVVQEFRDIKASIKSSGELHLFFQSPIISKTKKAEAVQALFQDRLSAYVISVLLLFIEKNREALILDIVEQIEELHRERGGIIVTKVHSAVEMNAQQRANLVQALESVSGKRVEAEYAVQSDLLGGLVVRLGDTVYDGSIQNQLTRLRNRFISG